MFCFLISIFSGLEEDRDLLVELDPVVWYIGVVFRVLLKSVQDSDIFPRYSNKHTCLHMFSYTCTLGDILTGKWYSVISVQTRSTLGGPCRAVYHFGCTRNHKLKCMEDLVDLVLGLMVTFGPNPGLFVFSWFSVGDGSEHLFLVFLRRCQGALVDVLGDDVEAALAGVEVVVTSP